MKLKLECLGFPTHLLRLFEGGKKGRLCSSRKQASGNVGLVLLNKHALGSIFLVRSWWLSVLLYNVDFVLCSMFYLCL